MKINFAGVKTDFEPVPDGIYECDFASYKMGVTGQNSRTPGEPKVDLQFAVTGDIPGEEEFKNRRVFRTCTFNADSLWAFKRTMVALGTTVDWEDPEGIDPEAVCREVQHNKCLVKVSVEDGLEDPITHQTKPQNRVLDILPTDALKLEQVQTPA
jgi:hypothetical protein